MKPDERRLLEELGRRIRSGDGAATPRGVAAEHGMPPKRCLLLCQGWWAKRWLEQSAGRGRGERFTTGRLTERGLRAAAGEDDPAERGQE